MFGYLQIQKSELLVREYEAYKSVYCGLCKKMGKDYSFLARLSLSYDCTFYAMLLMSVNRSCTGFNNGRCTFNPVKKCKFAKCSDDSYSKASAFSVISAYHKLIDDISDSKFFKKLITYLILPFFSHWRKKAKKRYPEIDEYVVHMMKMQSEIEYDKNCSIDKAAHPTGLMLARIFSLESDDEMNKKVFYEFGYHIGRWIYLADAADDIEKDRKSGNFNPFLNLSEEKFNKEYISATLNQSLARAYDAYNLIDIKDFKGILDNMILKGFPAVQNKITDKLTEAKNE